MAKKALLTVDAVHRKVKKGFVTDDARTHRKVRKAFITVGGVHRPCWSGGELAYYGTITGLYQYPMEHAATSIGNYAMFGGGRSVYGDRFSYVDVYDSSLTHSSAQLSTARYALSATSIKEYAFFGPGDGGGVKVDAFSPSLVRSAAPTSSHGSYYDAAASNEKYAVFAGGTSNGTNAYYGCSAYDASLTKSQPIIDAGRQQLAGVSFGKYALFGGGRLSNKNTNSTEVDAFDKSLTRTLPTGLSYARKQLAAAKAGNYALFGGGENVTEVVDAYDTSLTRSTPAALTQARYMLAATSLGNYAIFGGGYGAGSMRNTVDVYDQSLTRTAMTLSASRQQLAATSIENYALFGGGCNEDFEGSNVVDVFTIA